MNVSSSSTSNNINIWRTWALTVTYEVGEYTEQKFKAVKTGGEPVIPSPNLDTDLVMVCDCLVGVLIKVYKNPSGSSCIFGKFIDYSYSYDSSDADGYCKIQQIDLPEGHWA
jgi:hypothetical protein